jgi:hypothetical protein
MAEGSVFGSVYGKKLSILMSSRSILGPTQLSIQMVQMAVSPGVKRPWREAASSPPTSTEFKNTWTYHPLPIRLLGIVLS